MIQYHKIFIGLILFMTLSSCIGDEPLNAEADILEITLPAELLSRSPVILNDSVSVSLRQNVETGNLAPDFTLTPGAVIDPPSGTPRDFSTVQYYTVTSEDHKWSKRYAVRISSDRISLPGGMIEFNFDHANTLKGYYEFEQKNSNGDILFNWASGNPGFALTGKGDTPQAFPTTQSPHGHTGSCVQLKTTYAGSFGASFGKPIAAGSLFIGVFNTMKALSAPVKATEMGMEFPYEPDSLTGWFNYTPGPEFGIPDKSQSNGIKVVPGRVDQPAIYAVFFETTPDTPFLTGDNVLSDDNPQVISRAILPDSLATSTGGWKEFKLAFEPLNGRKVDPEKLQAGQYSLTFTMSSSRGGDLFEGAVGSTLLIDDVKLTVKQTQQ